jgi:16S rRNA processing protein RimM
LRDARPGYVLLARIGAAHGVRGEVRVKSHTADPLALANYGPLSSRDGRSFAVERIRPAKDVVIAKFYGVDDRNTAEALNGTDLFVDRTRLPAPEDEEEFYHADLIGLRAEGLDGLELGTLVAIHNFGAGDILEIVPSRGPSLLVPFTKVATPVIDLPGRRIVVSPPSEVEEDGDQGDGGAIRE